MGDLVNSSNYKASVDVALDPHNPALARDREPLSVDYGLLFQITESAMSHGLLFQILQNGPSTCDLVLLRDS